MKESEMGSMVGNKITNEKVRKIVKKKSGKGVETDREW